MRKLEFVSIRNSQQFQIPIRNSKLRGSPLGDVPTVAAEGVHQFHGTLDELGRLVHFFDRFAAVRVGDDDFIVAVGTVVADFVAELLAVFVEKPDHADFKPTTRTERSLRTKLHWSSELFTR